MKVSMDNAEDIKKQGQLLNSLLAELASELATVVKGRQRDDLSQAERRMYIRSAFATIEAWIYVMKQIALRAHPDPNCATINQAERAFAQEQEYKLADSGDVEIRRTKISLQANVRFAFKLLAKAGSVEQQLNVSSSEWQAFRRAITVRDRITHPKSVSELVITDEDYNDVSVGFGMVLIAHARLMHEILLKVNEGKANSEIARLMDAV